MSPIESHERTTTPNDLRQSARSAPIPSGTRGTGDPTFLLEARQLTKRYGPVIANRDVSFAVRPGEIVALLGENGAGKSTLMNVLYGMTVPDAGELAIDGKVVRLRSPRDALARGIGMVHQHFMLVPPFTVAENVALGNEPSRRGAIDIATVEARVASLASRFGMDVDPRAIVRDLSVGQQQRVEIVKALDRGARVLILDEPTAVLTPQEAEGLFRVLRGLAADGTAIVFISHKLGEVLSLAHRIVVMRRGAVVGEVLPEDATAESLAAMMVGREVMLRVDKSPSTPNEDRIVVRDLRVAGDHGGVAVDGVSFAVRAGEIVGIAGVQGNGQTELVEAISGLRPTAGGTLSLVGVEAHGLDVRARSMAGLAHVPEDRQRHGLVLPFSVADNLVLNRYHLPPLAQRGVRQARAIVAVARDLVARFDIRTPSPEVPVQALSGGNKQKVIIARELSHGLRALVAAQPTRGVDVGSIEFIHRSLVDARDAGAAVLVVSAELDELLSIADRILVMYRGRIVGEVPGSEATREGIGLFMAGGGGATQGSPPAGFAREDDVHYVN